jgi:putative transposase
MEGYRSSHAKYRCEYHFVWVPKYRYHVLVQEIKPRLKEILVELCEWLDIMIIEGAICSDHVHILIVFYALHHRLTRTLGQ